MKKKSNSPLIYWKIKPFFPGPSNEIFMKPFFWFIIEGLLLILDKPRMKGGKLITRIINVIGTYYAIYCQFIPINIYIYFVPGRFLLEVKLQCLRWNICDQIFLKGPHSSFIDPPPLHSHPSPSIASPGYVHFIISLLQKRKLIKFLLF